MINFLKELSPDVLVTVAEDWMWETEAFAEEETFISRAVEKRKKEFRAGRHCAHKVLSELGHPNFSLKVGNQRQPIWPEGIIGSISHTDGFCACAATPKGEIISLGIDVESINPVDRASLPLICTRKELINVEKLQSLSKAPLCKLIFSAKECVHKVYHPLNHYTLDFLDAEIHLDINNHTFTAHINNPEKQPKLPMKTLSGHFHFDEKFIYTIILKKQV